MIGHTIKRCYELIGYPLGCKKVSNPIKQNGFNKQNFHANTDAKTNDIQSSASFSSPGFIYKHMKKLLSMVDDTPSRSVHANIAVLCVKVPMMKGKLNQLRMAWLSLSEDNIQCVSSPSQSRSIFHQNKVVRYGIKKFVCYSWLNETNMCFATNLNKYVETTCYNDALSDSNWLDAMNNEIEALNRNNTWFICDLSIDRKPIGCSATRSSTTTDSQTPYKEPEREFRSSRRHFKTLSLDELRSPDFNLLSDQEYSEEEVAETMAETMEQYMSKTRADYGSGVARPKIEDNDNFELKGQFLKELRTNTFSGSDHEDANEHIEKVLEIVDLFHIPNITVDK
ncbi:hypothetical protein Tco_1438933 [Tanacetum coccineum]